MKSSPLRERRAELRGVPRSPARRRELCAMSDLATVAEPCSGAAAGASGPRPRMPPAGAGESHRPSPCSASSFSRRRDQRRAVGRSPAPSARHGGQARRGLDPAWVRHRRRAVTLRGEAAGRSHGSTQGRAGRPARGSSGSPGAGRSAQRAGAVQGPQARSAWPWPSRRTSQHDRRNRADHRTCEFKRGASRTASNIRRMIDRCYEEGFHVDTVTADHGRRGGRDLRRRRGGRPAIRPTRRTTPARSSTW